MKELLIVFIFANIANVIIQTVKSICTVKCGKGVAALVNAIAYGFYTYIIVLTNANLPLLYKCLIVAFCNLIGVYVVKYFEEKARKDKLWLVKITIPIENQEKVKKLLEIHNIPNTYYDLKKYFVFDCFCEKQKDTEKVLNICQKFNGKSFATENKI